MSVPNMGTALSQEEFTQCCDVLGSASDDTTKPQLALSFFKEREQGKGNRKAHLSASQLSHLVALTPSFETKKSLVLLLAPYVCPDASNYKAIVDLFPSAPDRAEIASLLMANNHTKLSGEPSASSIRTDLNSLNHSNASSSSNSSNNVFPMPQPRRREDLHQQQQQQQQQQQHLTSLSVSSGTMGSPMDLSSSSDDESSSGSRGGGGSDDGSSCNGGESRGGSTLNSQEDLDELGGGGGGGREGGGGSPLFGASSTASVAPSVLSFATSGGGGGGGSSLAGGPTPSVVDSLVAPVGSVATTLSSYDSTGSLSTIESSASAEVSQRRPFQHRSSLLKPVSEPSGGGGGGGEGGGDEER